MPGVSIRCHESDCGRSFQRCGSIALLDVPTNKVCYKGALLPARRTDLHRCPSNPAASNSSQTQSGIGACVCTSGCAWPSSCACTCQTGSGGSVLCQNPLKRYVSDAVARCCLRTSYSAARCAAARRPRMWTMALERVQQQFNELFFGDWALQDAASSFTFPAPLSVTGSCNCSPGGSCASVC